MTAHNAQVDHEELLEEGLDAEQLLNQLEVKKLAHRKKILNGMLAIPCLAPAAAAHAATVSGGSGGSTSALSANWSSLLADQSADEAELLDAAQATLENW
jgi:hypothetical protein